MPGVATGVGQGSSRAGEASSGPAGGAGPLAPVLRIASHAVVWSVVVVPVAIEMAEGWRPTRDDAMITIGAEQVFSRAPPLVGVWSLASQGRPRAFHDPGPLLFWLLAVPVRIDAGHGALWGAALVGGAVLSLAVEAVWSVVGWPGAVAVAVLAADLSWRTQLFSNLVWNPYIGLVFLVAAVAIGWAVATGRFGWWPLAVLTASVSAQCHLVDVLTVVAGRCGRARPRRRGRRLHHGRRRAADHGRRQGRPHSRPRHRPRGGRARPPGPVAVVFRPVAFRTDRLGFGAYAVDGWGVAAILMAAILMAAILMADGRWPPS